MDLDAFLDFDTIFRSIREGFYIVLKVPFNIMRSLPWQIRTAGAIFLIVLAVGIVVYIRRNRDSWMYVKY